MRVILLSLFVCASVLAQSSGYPPGSGGGLPVLTCAGSPGNTVGAYKQQCQASGVVYACTNASGCTVAGDWSAQGGSGGPPSGTAGGSLAGTYPNPTILSGVTLPGTPKMGTKPASNDNSLNLAPTNWVTQKLAALNPATSVAAGTITVLPNSPAYLNGTAGVGATLTATSPAALVIDGYTVLISDRVLVNNQVNPIQNGVYTQTTVGNGGVDYVLTRASDFNTPTAINNAGVIPVTNGSVNNGTTWALDNSVTTIGVSAINYDQTNAQPPVVTNVNGVPCTAGATPGCTANWTTGSITTLHVAQFNGTSGQIKDGGVLPVSPTTNQNIRTIGASFGDFSSGASALTTAQIACIPTYFAGTIAAVELIGTPSGSATVDVKTVAHGSFTGPAATSSITASDIPALASATTFSDTTLTGWTTAFTAGTDVCFYLTSPTTVAGVTITVKVAAN